MNAASEVSITRPLVNGEGKLDVLMNARCPTMQPTTVRDYVAHEGL